MGSKLSVTSTNSYRSTSSSSSSDKPRIPKYLKPTKLSKKQQREKQQQQQQQHAVAIPYEPDIENSNSKHTNTNGSSSPNPPFVFIRNGSHYSMAKQQQQQQQEQQQGISVIDQDGPKNAFQWFEGRRYRNQDSSLLPNDDRELDRQRVLNYILRWALEGDFVAPVKTKLLEGTHVLNVGCGPGIWLGHPVIDFALDYPKSHFTAIDVLDLLPKQDIYATHDTTTTTNDPSFANFSPRHPMLPTTISSSTWHQQSSTSTVAASPLPTKNNDITSSSTTSPSSCPPPPAPLLPTRSIFNNLDIYALDIRERGLPFSDNTFEFVMQRLTAPVYSVQQWHDVVRELVRVTRPGGYIQLIEADYNGHGLGPYGQSWQDSCTTMLNKTRNLDPFIATQLDSLLLENGLVNVQVKKISIPLGPWGLDIGILWQQNLEAFIEASAPAFGLAFRISAAEVIASFQKYKDELKYVKAFTNVYAVWGQKPESTTTSSSSSSSS